MSTPRCHCPMWLTLPCTWPSVCTLSHACLPVASWPIRLFSNKNLHSCLASGNSILLSICSSTLGSPDGVNASGTHPRFISRSAICCLDAGLKGITFSLVFNCTIVGSMFDTSDCSSSAFSPASSLYNFSALATSNGKP